MHSPAVAFSYAEAVEQRGMSVIPRWLAIELNLVDVADRDVASEPRS